MKKITIDLKAEDLRKKLNLKDGVNGRDGKDGVNGTDGLDGKDADINEVIEKVKPLIPSKEEIANNIPILGDKVRDSLELLQDENRLSRTAIDGLDDYEEISQLAREPRQEVKKYYSGGGGGNLSATNSLMSTGIIFGGELSINADPTKIDISAGAGYVVDDTVVPATLKYVEWNAFTAVTLTDLATADSTDIAINSSSAVVQQRSYTNSELRSVIFLGGVDHTGGTVRNTFSVQVPSFAPALSVRDLARAVGDLNISGNTFGAASTNLTISKTSGQSFSFGRNTVDDKTNPHIISQDAVSPITFNYIFQDGSGGATVSTATSNINPLNYDDGSGTLATVGVNDFAFQNILLFPNSNKVFVQYGTVTYNTLNEAINGLASTTFPTLTGFTSAMRRGVLIVKRGTTNLADTTDARFFAADKFGSIAGAVGTGVSPDLSVYAQKVGADDIEITDATKGIILKSPDNTRFRVTVDNTGALITTSL